MTTLVVCQQLEKNYGRNKVLRKVDLSIEAGAPVALVGANGAGKTTLLSLLCGYIQPDAGQIRLLGQRPGSTALIGQLGALPQDAQFDPDFRLKQQLSWMARMQGMSQAAADKDSCRVLESLDLTAQANEKVAALSHGMRKRLAIAQALLGSPKLVLLDEPTAGLDPVHSRALRSLIQQLSADCTFVISSHNLFELEQLCGTVLFMQQGQIRQQLSNQAEQGQLQLVMEPCETAQVTALLQQLYGLSRWQQDGAQQFQLEYDVLQHPDLDVQLLQALHQHQLHYRQLSRGQSLEQRLFQPHRKPAN